MPLIKSRSKAALKKNIATEMRAHPDDPKRDLAIAFSVKRKAPKKKASGGTVESGSRDMNYADGGEAKHSEFNEMSDRHKEYSNKLDEHGKSLGQTGSSFKSDIKGSTHGAGFKDESTANEFAKEAAKHGKVTRSSSSGHHFVDVRMNKQYAEGGPVSAATEKRPTTTEECYDADEISENSNKKELYDSNWTDRPDVKQTTKGMKTTKIKHPKMASSGVFQAKLRDAEDDLQASAAPASPKDQPSKSMDEEDAKKHGEAPEKQTAISTKRQVMAEGGEVEHSDYDHSDPNSDTDSDMHLSPSEDEAASMAEHHEEEYQRQTSGNPDYARPHSDDLDTAMYAEGGLATEEEIEHAASIAAAIMARRKAAGGSVESGSEDMNYADGGEVDLDLNSTEQPNEYPPMNGEALDWDDDADYLDAKQPEDSNEHGDTDNEDEDEHGKSLASKIRSSMKKRSPITR